MYFNVQRNMKWAETLLENDPRKIIFLRKQVESLINVVRERSKEIEDEDELRDSFFDEIINLSENYASISNLSQLYYGYTIGKDLEAIEADVRKIYLEIKSEQEEEYCSEYSANNEKARRQHINNILVVGREKGVEFTTKGLTEVNRNLVKATEKQLKERLIKSIELVGEFFERFGLFSVYKDSYDFLLSQINLSEMSREISTGEHSEDKLGIKESLEEEYLKQRSIDELVLIYVSWQNHFAKECEQMNQALFIMNEMSLFGKDKLNGKIEISDEEMKKYFVKTKVLNGLSRRLMVFAKDADIESVAKDGYRQMKIEDILKGVDRAVFYEYQQQFQTGLKEDVGNYLPLINIVDNVYINKDNMLKMLINNFSNYSTIRNWGYIEEKNYINTSIIDKKNMVIGIDFEGANMPLRSHVSKQLVIDYYKANKKDPIIPIYEGASDFVIPYENKLINTIMYLPLSKLDKAVLKKKLKDEEKGSPMHNLYEHLIFLTDSDKFPEHLCEEVSRGKKILYRRKPRKYINLESGEIYVKGKNGYESFSGR